MNKLDLITKVKALDGITQDERAYLINLVNTKKKYGLVWEDKPEDVEEQLRENLPVLKEVKDKAIVNGEEHPNHILIEGDNLHALTALSFTHEGQVDVMYFDPPYNTGNKDFRYNDTYVDKEDSYRHSKWLSFMSKRLLIAKRLLNDKGVIFISIDNNEQSQLKLLCDEIFGEQNFISNVAVINNLKGRSDDKYIATAHENLLIYKKNSFETLGVPAPDEYTDEYKLNDNVGLYRLQGLRKRGDNSKREDRPNLFYPIYFEPNQNSWGLIKEDFINPVEIIPKLSDGSEGNWRWGKETLIARKEEIVIQKVRKRNEFDVFQKDYLLKNGNEIKRIKPKSFWTGSEYATDAGTKSLKEVISNADFRSPKSPYLIKFCLSQSAEKSSTILDIFAGSGTTLHSTMQLNAEDGGNRQCILVTNNENNIAEAVCYERNKRVIQGFSNAKGDQVEGLTNNNLRYYKSEVLSRQPTLKNKRELTKLATELLCIKENIYTEVKALGSYQLNSKYVRCFGNEGNYLIIIYDDEVIDQIVDVVKDSVKQKENKQAKFKVYVFSNGQYPYTEEFEDILEHITLCALPDAIYKAYQNVLPKKNRQIVPELEEDIEQNNSTLFN